MVAYDGMLYGMVALMYHRTEVEICVTRKPTCILCPHLALNTSVAIISPGGFNAELYKNLKFFHQIYWDVQ